MTIKSRKSVAFTNVNNAPAETDSLGGRRKIRDQNTALREQSAAKRFRDI
jgi:hypothetical protein